MSYKLLVFFGILSGCTHKVTTYEQQVECAAYTVQPRCHLFVRKDGTESEHETDVCEVLLNDGRKVKTYRWRLDPIHKLACFVH